MTEEKLTQEIIDLATKWYEGDIQEEEMKRQAQNLVKIDRYEQLALCNVGCSLPSKEELFSVCEKIVEEKHKGLDEIQKEYIKLGFMYYHRYLSDRNKK